MGFCGLMAAGIVAAVSFALGLTYMEEVAAMRPHEGDTPWEAASKLRKRAVRASVQMDTSSAFELYNKACRLERQLNLTADEDPSHPLQSNSWKQVNTFTHINRVKLRHDAEQMRLLIKRKKLPAKPYAQVADMYIEAANGLPTGTMGEMPASWPTLLRRTLNRVVHLTEPARLPTAASSTPTLSPSFDGAAVQKRFYAGGLPDADGCDAQNGLTHVDDVLSGEALKALLRWCEESMMWFDSRPGYLGAFQREAFNSPLLGQVADDLRTALPDILGPHHLINAWAFKCTGCPPLRHYPPALSSQLPALLSCCSPDATHRTSRPSTAALPASSQLLVLPSRCSHGAIHHTSRRRYSNEPTDWEPSGIKVHADRAAVNLNLWLTDDRANEEEGGGGLTLFAKQAPANW